MNEETMRMADRRSRFANSTKIFVFATSSQKDEKKDEKKAAGCMLECLSLQHAQVIVGGVENHKFFRLPWYFHQIFVAITKINIKFDKNQNWACIFRVHG